MRLESYNAIDRFIVVYRFRPFLRIIPKRDPSVETGTRKRNESFKYRVVHGL